MKDLKLLFKLISNRKNEEALKILSGKPSMLSEIDIDGWNVLHHCCLCGNIELVRELIKKFNCNINCKTNYGYTPILIASYYQNINFISELIDLGADATIEDRGGRLFSDVLSERGFKNLPF